MLLTSTRLTLQNFFGKLKDLQKEMTIVKDPRKQAENGRREIVTVFLNELPAGLRGQVMEYVRYRAKQENGEVKVE